MRPIIQLTPTVTDKVLNTCSGVLLGFLWVFASYAFVKMPEIIPTHYNASGEVDDHGNKATILLLPVIATIIMAGISRLNKYPHIFNYATDITEANAEQQYTFATRMLRFLQLAVVLIALEITASTYSIAIGKASKINGWFLPIEIAIMIVPTIFILVQAGKKKKVAQ